MKKYLGYAAVIGLAIPVSFALPTAAQAGHVPPLCKLIINENGGDVEFPVPNYGLQTFHFDTIGQCVSFLNTLGAQSNAPTCKGVVALGWLELLGFKSFADCVVNFEV